MPKINWQVRIRNKTFLASMAALLIAFIYDLLALLRAAPGVEQSAVLTLVNAALTVLCAAGIIADPTTAGVGDSARAMTYKQPAKE